MRLDSCMHVDCGSPCLAAVSLGSYEAKYLGSVAVSEPRGKQIALDAFERIKVPLLSNLSLCSSTCH